MADDITNGELARRIDSVLAEIRRIEDRYVTKDSHDAHLLRTSQLEEKATRASALVWGSLILPIITAVILYVVIKGGP